MFVIGVDPHKGSHTAAVLNTTEEVISEQRLERRPASSSNTFWSGPKPFVPRRWALEGASGTGALLARQLVAAGEHVVDVPPTLTARVQVAGPRSQRQDRPP